MSVKIKDFTLPSTDNSHNLHTVIWQDDGVHPKGVVQIIHGMCEYIKRYSDFAEYMAENGFIVCGHDHLGHGETAAFDSELGYFAAKDGWKLLVDDCYVVTTELRKMYPDLKLFVLGHSMGSFILENYLSKYGSKIDGALISGTGGPNPLGGFGDSLAKIIAAAKGGTYRSKLLDNMAFGNYCSKIKGKRTNKDWLTYDAAIVDKYCADKFCMFTFTVSAFRDLFRLLSNATAEGWAGTVPNDLPVIYFAGNEDPVGNYGKGVAIMYDRLAKSGQKDISLRLYDGMRHETLNEIGKQQVWDDVRLWISDRL